MELLVVEELEKGIFLGGEYKRRKRNRGGALDSDEHLI